MALPVTLDIALKEWASVCEALVEGRQMILLRKGGIHEAAGEFELENPQFVLFPTYLHQNLSMLKASEHARFVAASAEPATVTLAAVGEVTDIFQLESRAQMEAIEEEHIWTRPLIEMRFNYRPANPLYLMLVRAYRLAKPVTVENTLAYAGCKSWVPLERVIETAGAEAALDDEAYEARRERIREKTGV